MTKPLKLLLVEDSPEDAELVLRHLRAAGFDPAFERVETASAMMEALARTSWDVVLSDNALPTFSGLKALSLLRDVDPDVPFIFISGTLGEEAAVAAMRAGAQDYIIKGNLVRLGAAVDRELRRVAMRRERVEAERRLTAVLDALPIVVYSFRKGERLDLTWISPNVEELTGFARLRLLAEQPLWWSRIHPEDRERVVGELRQVNGRRSVSVEYRWEHADGRRRWILDHAAGGPALGGEAIGVWMDVTDRKSLEEQYRHAQKMESMGILAGGVAHDFNNLLMVIGGYTELLAESSAPESPARRDIEEIRSAASRAASLTRQLLAFSRRQLLQPVALDLHSLVDGTVKMLRRLIGEDVALVVKHSLEPAIVHADPGQMEQIVVNLAVNSRDAMPSGGTLTISTAVVGPRAELTVSDTGIGMDAETRARIFEPFFTTKGVGKGTGLGLATVHGIVTQSGGAIEVESAPGQGATFRVSIPLTQEVPAAAVAGGEATPRGGGETILLVEDEEAVRALAARLLRERGYRVLEARNADEAAEIVTEPVRLLLTDVVMPGTRGPDLARRLKERIPRLKVLYMSGYTGDAIVSAEQMEGASFLQKPFAPADLLRTVRRILD